jgi:sulfur-carrier protein
VKSVPPTTVIKPKLVVKLGGPLQSAAGGVTEFVVEAATIQEMLTKLGEAYPALRPVLAKSVSVAVDGQVYRGAWQKPLREGAEIYLLPPMQGG